MISLPPLSSVERLHRFTFRFGRRALVRGFDVRAMLPSRIHREMIFGKCGAALDLIATNDERRFEYLLRDLPRVWVAALPGSLAQCHSRLGMCILDFAYVTAAETSEVQLAQTLVHEGAHARLDRAGFGFGERERDRIERICVLQEAAFTRRVLGAESLVVDAEERMQAPNEHFSNRAQRERELQALEDSGLVGRLANRVFRAFRRAV